MPNTELSDDALGHRLLYRPTEAAALLGISRSNLYILMASGEIESIRIGRARRFTRQALVDFVARCAEESGSCGGQPAAALRSSRDDDAVSR